MARTWWKINKEGICPARFVNCTWKNRAFEWEINGKKKTKARGLNPAQGIVFVMWNKHWRFCIEPRHGGSFRLKALIGRFKDQGTGIKSGSRRVDCNCSWNILFSGGIELSLQVELHFDYRLNCIVVAGWIAFWLQVEGCIACWLQVEGWFAFRLQVEGWFAFRL